MLMKHVLLNAGKFVRSLKLMRLIPGCLSICVTTWMQCTNAFSITQK